MDPILVTGAAGGTQGSTGRTVAELLLRRGYDVRAFVHTDDDRADRLRGLGAEVVVGDLREISSVLPAFDGVRRVFFTYPVTDGLLDATGAVAVAARECGVERLVNVSQLAAGPDAPTPHMRQHWLSEQVFDWAGVGAVHLRAAVFFENLAVVLAAGGGRELALPLGSPETVVPLVAAADVAGVAAGILADPALDVDPVCLLTGEILSVGEIVRAFGAAAGADVRYTDASPADWERRAIAIYRDPHVVEHLSKLWEIFRLIGSGHDLYQVTDAIERIGGHPPRTLRAFPGVPAAPG
ncbi:uncharacterized protein YbjT (DUF2867 family) [Murinocardiopsis flavida]|uniref:Uncharacterized protein YbjT (DUF2867 family) n=1 Tax=Murinocardiopsis flavida TaxID=645275 RepID=A0A2P8CSY0_9ACTN|nr:NmrA family NAD(P)-binding protein [Murinocardiopsis flavida]PSK88076.1 uncharacterized protein YbjT (DUF2867 family) [Murinocardiopsis flavida]